MSCKRIDFRRLGVAVESVYARAKIYREIADGKCFLIRYNVYIYKI